MSFSSNFFDSVSTGLTPYGSNTNNQDTSNVFDYQFNESAPRASPLSMQQQGFDQSTQLNFNAGASFRPERSLSSSSSNIAQAHTQNASSQPKIAKRARSNRSGSSSSPAVGTSDLAGSQSPEGEGKGKRPDRRAKFLERNRIAASKCRSKKKEWTNNLEAAARQASQQSRELHQIVARLRDELLVYKTELMQQRGCSCGEVDRFMQSGNVSQLATTQPSGELYYADAQQQMQMHNQRMHQQQVNNAAGYPDGGYSNYEATYMDGQ